MLGLGISFIRNGMLMMKENFYIALIALVLGFFFLNNKKLPTMVIILLFGIIASLVLNPELLGQLLNIKPSFKLPQLVLEKPSYNDLIAGFLLLALPQLPLTFGNAILVITAENNRLFPEKPVSERKCQSLQG